MDEKELAQILQKEAIKAEKQLILLLKQSGLINQCYSYKSRVKADILEKITRKRRKKPEYTIQDVTDIIGLRFITLFRLEMSEIYTKIIDLIFHKEHLNANPFLNGCLQEVKVFHTSPHDKIPDKIKDISKSMDITIEIETEMVEREYSSIHLIALLNWEIKELSSEIKYQIPVEIQIRTAFEDAWGEIDHIYKYDAEKREELGKTEKKLTSISRHLKVMKKFADACAEYADAIHADANFESEAEAIDRQGVVSVETDRETIDRFRQLGVKNEYIGSYQRARAQRLRAEGDERECKGSGGKPFLVSAQMFSQTAEDIDQLKLDQEDLASYLLYYYCKMNEAICYLSTNKLAYVEIALNMYKDLTRVYYDFPLLKMRLGQAYGKLKYIDLAIDYLEKSHLEILTFESNGKRYSDCIPIVDYRHLKTYLPKVYGYYLWQKSEKLKNNQMKVHDRVQTLLKAYDITSRIVIYDNNKDKHVLLDKENNLLYYSLELFVIKRDGYPITGFNPLEKIRTHLACLETEVDIEITKDIETLDTFLRAYDYIGDLSKVELIIRRLIPLAQEALDPEACDVEVVTHILEYAKSMNEKREIVSAEIT